jgi:hypothetical protein
MKTKIITTNIAKAPYIFLVHRYFFIVGIIYKHMPGIAP